MRSLSINNELFGFYISFCESFRGVGADRFFKNFCTNLGFQSLCRAVAIQHKSETRRTLLNRVCDLSTQYSTTSFVQMLNRMVWHLFSSCFMCPCRKKKMEKSWAPCHPVKTSFSSRALDQDKSMKSPSTLSKTTPEDPKHPRKSLPVSLKLWDHKCLKNIQYPFQMACHFPCSVWQRLVC